MFPHLSGPDESWAGVHGTLPGGLADCLGGIKIGDSLAALSPMTSCSWRGETLATGQRRCRTCCLLQRFWMVCIFLWAGKCQELKCWKSPIKCSFLSSPEFL